MKVFKILINVKVSNNNNFSFLIQFLVLIYNINILSVYSKYKYFYPLVVKVY